MKVFHCDHCGQLLFFENVTCMRCGRALAFVPELADVVSLEQVSSEEGLFDTRSGTRVRLCTNYVRHQVCNWAIALGSPSDRGPMSLCRACELTRTIPNLGTAGNDRLWYKLEAAKRRLVYTLDQLGLGFRSKRIDATGGLAFDFIEGVVTGHASGVITVALEEADDAVRVKRRIELNEPYRTILGHLRHESGHYYWSELVDGTPRIEPFRALFGDERASYEEAIRRHYAEGAPFAWQDGFVSAYATMHPWEDWAETWAHYLHMVDTLETASASGISITPARADEPTVRSVPDPTASRATFERMLESWGPITYVLNNLNRGLGNDDAYPFVLSTKSTEKLRFVHETIAASR